MPSDNAAVSARKVYQLQFTVQAGLVQRSGRGHLSDFGLDIVPAGDPNTVIAIRQYILCRYLFENLCGRMRLVMRAPGPMTGCSDGSLRCRS